MIEPVTDAELAEFRFIAENHPGGFIPTEHVARIIARLDELDAALSLMGGHDRSGLNHLEDAMKAAEERDDAEADLRAKNQELAVLRDLIQQAEKGDIHPRDLYAAAKKEG